MKTSAWIKGCALLLLLLWGRQMQAQDCGCTAGQTVQQAFEEASLVMVGKVVRVITNPNKAGLNITFRADSSWKRSVDPYPTIFTPYPDRCGFDFVPEQRYLVFSHKKHQNQHTSICDPNRIVEAGDADLRSFGKAFLPATPANAFRNNVILTVLSLLGLIFVAFVVLRRRKKPTA